ncbi:hypothetical protein [Parabacteroides sp. ZJ-118]|uniref:hypothetical protein n=1 Tax=Parabacteroides sp. ZJ-118 TaxID=2709398 RepID=UPI001F1564FD|nr:hypothetical protein [Parabacteroides sp. ZJ-118]
MKKEEITVLFRIAARRGVLLSLFAGMFSVYVYGADNLRLPDVRSVGMGGNVATQSVLFNPALIIDKERKSIHLEYFNRYMLKELGTMSGSFHYPNRLLSAGVDISVFGFDAYREMMVRVLGGKRLGDKWALGLAIHYSFLQTERLEHTRSRLSTDIGITFSPIDKLLVGMLIMNFPSISIGEKDIEIEDFNYYLIQVSFQWNVLNSLLITGSVGTENENLVVGNLGIEYTAFDSFFIRAGIQTAPLSPSFGIGYNFSCFTVDVASVYHPVLGMSAGLGLSFSF